MKYFMAIDIGASSGRHVLGYVKGGRIITEEIYRFENSLIRKNGHDCWDTEALFDEILNGLKECRRAGKIPEFVGVDTWAVDYVLLDDRGKMLGDSVSYRDSRTNGIRMAVEELISPEMLYKKTGIQYQKFNTIYQLTVLKKEHPKQLDAASRFLMIPEYMNYRLTGIMQNEYTNATSTNMVNTHEKTWDFEIIDKLGISREIFGSLAMPGTVLGDFSVEIQKIVGFNSSVILPATHDTGSAFLAVPAENDDAVYISSGTWSLLGVENREPITTSESLKKNFTNEGGAWYRYRYLKNIMGLWMIQSVRRELNGTSYIKGNEKRSEKQWSFDELVAEAERAEFKSVIDVNKNRFLSPRSMIEEIKDECKCTGQAVPKSVGEIVKCVYLSLAKCYAETISELEKLTGRKFKSVNIVGGGCRDEYLNRITAEETKLPVFAGPTEGTAIGNLIVQMIADGEFSNLNEARKAIKRSFDVKEFKI